MTKEYQLGFIQKCAAMGVDPQLLVKSAGLDEATRRQRRKKMVLATLGIGGAAMGGITGAMPMMPGSIGGGPASLTRGLLGAGIGGALGLGAGALRNSIADYTDTDPLLMTLRTESQR